MDQVSRRVRAGYCGPTLLFPVILAYTNAT